MEKTITIAAAMFVGIVVGTGIGQEAQRKKTQRELKKAKKRLDNYLETSYDDTTMRKLLTDEMYFLFREIQ